MEPSKYICTILTRWTSIISTIPIRKSRPYSTAESSKGWNLESRFLQINSLWQRCVSTLFLILEDVSIYSRMFSSTKHQYNIISLRVIFIRNSGFSIWLSNQFKKCIIQATTSRHWMTIPSLKSKERPWNNGTGVTVNQPDRLTPIWSQGKQYKRRPSKNGIRSLIHWLISK